MQKHTNTHRHTKTAKQPLKTEDFGIWTVEEQISDGKSKCNFRYCASESAGCHEIWHWHPRVKHSCPL